MNIVFLLLLIALPFSFEYNFSSGLGTDIPDEFLMLFVSLLFFAYWLYSPSVLGTNVMQHPLLLFFLISTCWIFIAATFSTHQQISFKYLLAKGWYIGAFVLAPLIAWKEKKIIIKSGSLLITSMMLVILIALVRHYQTGFSFATINDAIFPFFRNHVNYSAMLVCLIPVGLAFYQLSNNSTQRRWISLFILFLFKRCMAGISGWYYCLLADKKTTAFLFIYRCDCADDYFTFLDQG